MRRRLEHEIRLLPQVVACTVTDDAVVVLVEPDADAARTELAVREIVDRIDGDLHPRVVGGVVPVLRRPPAVGLPRTAVLVAVASTGLLGLGALIGGLRLDQEVAAPPARAGAPVPDAVPAPRTSPAERLAELEETPAPGRALGPRTVHAASPRRTDPAPPAKRVGLEIDVRVPTAPSTETLTPPERSASAAGLTARAQRVTARRRIPGGDCAGPPDRGAPWPLRGKHEGEGPRVWSRSILADPYDLCPHGSWS